ILGGALALGNNMQESFAIPGTESQDALDHLEAVFPQVAGSSVQIVVEAPEGASVDDPAVASVIDEIGEQAEALGFVDTVVGPFSEYAASAVSDDKSMARIQVQLAGSTTDVTDEQRERLTALAATGEDAGLTVEF